MSKFTILLLISILWSCGNQKNNTDQTVAKKQPNIIFFIADDMYPEMFNCLPEGKGKNLTPNMDRLAAEGTLLINQYVVSPVCTPSRYNTLTGKYASRAKNKTFQQFTQKNGGQTVIQWNSFITNNDKVLPHYLKELGYKTGMVGKNHVIEVDSLYRFPDFWADPKNPEIKEKVEENYYRCEQAILNNGFDYAGAIYQDNPDFVGLGELAVQNMDWIAEAGLNFIDQNKHNPFFLYFATTIPHGPTNAERSWEANPLVTAKGYLDQAPNVLPARNTLSARIKEAGLSGGNKENILWLDDALGALLNKLEANNILDNTIIFFFNDHGQKAKGTLYQGGVLNPSIVWKKGGFESGNVCHAKVLNIDFAPTIVELTGGKLTEGQFDGKSFVPDLNGEENHSDEPLFFELGYARAIVKGDYKYLAVRYPEFAENMSKKERAEVLEKYNEGRRFRGMNTNDSDPMTPYSHFSLIPGGQDAEHGSYGKVPHYFDRDQLYNLKEDPNEQINLINSEAHQKIFQELKAELTKHLSNMPGSFDI
ncbi:sulfatase family protein [Flexithrix dorotheae]|uniref:sulfatase family protein n=1 Tax=Flexithrix dorotheae TaxID=70993 RepID=UPI00037DAD58|nr:sulfatase-like hydrolase/transferase [Flexithrix dorotheae]